MKKILVIAAHPDDEFLGCGATLLSLKKQGFKIKTLFLADGESSRLLKKKKRNKLIQDRETQARNLAKKCNFLSPIFSRFPDNKLDTLSRLEIIKVIDRTPNIFWKLRLHPVQLMDNRYERHKLWLEDFVERRLNCEWESASNGHFLDIVNSCDGHLTMQSSSCYEAAAIGVRSLCLCPALQKGGRNFGRFARLENEGFVVVGEAKSKIVEGWVSNVKPINARINQTQHLNFPEMIEFLKEKLINF